MAGGLSPNTSYILAVHATNDKVNIFIVNFQERHFDIVVIVSTAGALVVITV